MHLIVEPAVLQQYSLSSACQRGEENETSCFASRKSESGGGGGLNKNSKLGSDIHSISRSRPTSSSLSALCKERGRRLNRE